MNALRQHISREWQLLASDGWLRALLSWLPIGLFFVLWWIFSAGLPRDLPIGIVDMDSSDLSRSLTRTYGAHPGLSIAHHYSNTGQGSAAMREGEIIALVVIPRHLKTDTLNGRSPQVTAFYNSQFLLTGKLVASAIQQTQANFDASLSVIKAMDSGKSSVQALGIAVPISTQITPLFNTNSNYAHFLAAALIPASWQILIVLVTLLSLSRELRGQGLGTWLGKHPVAAVFGKLLPYTLILSLQGALFLWFMYGQLGWPMHGSWAIILLSQWLMVLASQGVALLLFLLVRNSVRALSLAAAYTAPSFAFMGVTFPVSDMNSAAQIWRDLLPVSHYIEIQLLQANHGASLPAVAPQIGSLLLFTLAYLLAFKLIKRIHKQQTAAAVHSS